MYHSFTLYRDFTIQKVFEFNGYLTSKTEPGGIRKTVWTEDGDILAQTLILTSWVIKYGPDEALKMGYRALDNQLDGVVSAFRILFKSDIEYKFKGCGLQFRWRIPKQNNCVTIKRLNDGRAI